MTETQTQHYWNVIAADLEAWNRKADAYFETLLLRNYLYGREIVVTTSGTLLKGAPVVYQPRHDGDRYPWYAIAPGTTCSGWRYRSNEVGTE
jgi:hypothetical protein